MDVWPKKPGLRPNYYLFLSTKYKMLGQSFNSSGKVVVTYQYHVSAVPLSEWHKCFENSFIRVRKCMSAKGEYFEKQ